VDSLNTNVLKKGLIVSCQAKEDEPLHGPQFMAKMALAAEIGGAVGVRINTVKDIEAVKREVQIPIIGIIKHEYPNFFPYITPTLKEVEAVYNAGANIVAVDATKYAKPDGKTTEQFIYDIKEKFDIAVMADVSTVEEGITAANAGADYIGSTLAGYTEYTKGNFDEPIEFQPPDLNLVEQLASKIDKPIIAEGKYWDYKLAIKAFERGAYAVVIGAGITRPQIITQKNVKYINEYLYKGIK
jgi:N-acylglucosamine-6-phosphate 2-epimerase